MEHFYSGIGGWFNFSDVYEDMVKKSPDNAHFVEIGAWEGKSTSFMVVEIINSGKSIKFDVVDTWKGSSEHKNLGVIKEDKLFEKFTENLKNVKDHFTPLQMTSLEASKLYEDNSLDFVFIDGAHEYAAVKADIEAWLPKVKEGGYIGGDDYNFGDVNKAVDEILGKDNLEFSQKSWKSWIYKK